MPRWVRHTGKRAFNTSHTPPTCTNAGNDEQAARCETERETSRNLHEEINSKDNGETKRANERVVNRRIARWIHEALEIRFDVKSGRECEVVEKFETGFARAIARSGIVLEVGVRNVEACRVLVALCACAYQRRAAADLLRDDAHAIICSTVLREHGQRAATVVARLRLLSLRPPRAHIVE